jgi:hypothetical protein
MNHISDFSNAVWHKSTKSATGGCVEVATLERVVGVRDSKDRQGPVLVFRFDEWNAFLAGVRDFEFDLPDDPAGSRSIPPHDGPGLARPPDAGSLLGRVESPDNW